VDPDLSSEVCRTKALDCMIQAEILDDLRTGPRCCSTPSGGTGSPSTGSGLPDSWCPAV
jgi:hypothetical protein